MREVRVQISCNHAQKDLDLLWVVRNLTQQCWKNQGSCLLHPAAEVLGGPVGVDLFAGKEQKSVELALELRWNCCHIGSGLGFGDDTEAPALGPYPEVISENAPMARLLSHRGS